MALKIKNACNAGYLSSVPGLGRFPGGGHGNPLQYSCLDSPHGQRSLAGCSLWARRELEKGYFVGFLLCAHLKVQFMASVLLRLRWIREWVSDVY